MIRSRADAALGDALHRSYRTRPGSSFIASGFALGAIRAEVRRRRPTAVLEVGAGIGAITACLVEVLHEQEGPVTQVGVEDVPFCLEQLAANLGDQLDEVVVVAQVRQIPAVLGDFDLVIVDGGAVTDLLEQDRDRWSTDDERAEVSAWMARLAAGGLVLVENRRDPQREMIEAEARRRGRSFAHDHVRPLDDSPGLHRYQFEPSGAVQLGSRGGGALRAAWFPHGIRTWRRVRSRLGWPPVSRDTVSPGDLGS